MTVVNLTVNDFTSKPQLCPGSVYEFCPREDKTDEEKDGQQRGRKQRSWSEMDNDLEEGGRTGEGEKERDDEEMRRRLYMLVSQARFTYSSSTEDEPDGEGQGEEEWNTNADMDKAYKEQVQTEKLASRLCQLENEVRATQFSLTEDELDRMGLEMENKQDEIEKEEELAVKLCRLSNKVNASQYSSTDDELDKAVRGDDGVHEKKLWRVQLERTQLCDLASLVSASQFSSTEDELDRLGDNERKHGNEKNGCTRKMRELWDGEESIGDIDMKMFDLTETEEREQEGAERGKCQPKVQDDGTGMQKNKQVIRDGKMGMGQIYDKFREIFKEPVGKQEIHIKTEMKAGRTEALQEAKAEKVKEPHSKRTEEKVEQVFLKESEGSERTSETDSKSDQGDAEFDQIISSMLMMTLEDMEAEMMDKAEQNEQRKPENVDVKGELGFREREDAIEEMDKMSESEIKICISEKTDGKIFDKQQKDNNTGGDENTHEQNCRGMTTINELQTNETKPTCLKGEEKSENQDGRRNTAELEGAEMHLDNTHCDQRDVDSYVKEGIKVENMEQSSSYTHLGEFLSPEEIQNVSTRAVSSIFFIDYIFKRMNSLTIK